MFSAAIRRFSLPLLAKDLVEASNRRRTYILRVVYALLLYGFAFLMYLDIANAYGKSALELLGTGEYLLNITFGLQCAGICLFMPALSAGAFTIEKEKNTLTLLFLTRLGPWAILFEKYLARVIHMCGFLLISLPLFGIAYSLGGVTQLEMWSAVWTLVLFTAQVGAISIACSAFFMSTSAAFIWTYLIGASLYLLPPISMEILGYGTYQQLLAPLEGFVNRIAWSTWGPIWEMIVPWIESDPAKAAEMSIFRPFSAGQGDFICIFFPVNLMISTFWDRPGPMGPAAWHVLVRSIPSGGIIVTSLILARSWLVSRASVQPQHRIMRAFRSIDQYFHKINQNKWTKGKVLINDTEILPVDRPIAWRETKKRAFGTARYLVRMLLLIELPIMLLCIAVMTFSLNRNSYWNRSPVLASMSMITWILSLLFLISKAATALPGERLGETFDVLLSTPLKTRDIVQQKFAGVNRLIWVLSVPLATIMVTHAIWIETSNKAIWDRQGVAFYILGSLASLVIYPRMIAWLSMLVGLVIRSQTKAIFTTLAIVVGWCIVPIIGLFIWDEILDLPLSWDSPIANASWALSPMVLIGATETAEFQWLGLIVAVSAIQYGMITIAIRELCLSSAAAMLGRPESNRPQGWSQSKRRTEQATGVRKL